MDLDSLRRRFRYHAWASSTLAAALPTEGAPAARTPLAHAFVADRLWLLRLRAESTDGLVIWPDLDAAACRALALRNADALAVFLAELAPDALGETATYINSAGVAYETPVGDILDHVLLHGAYHRGQAARALREAGIAPPPTDYIVWQRLGEPAAG